MILMQRSQPDARAIIQPQPTPFRLLARHLEPLLSPDPRMHAELRDDGWRVNHKRVRRLMRQAGLQGVKSRVVCKSERKLLDASVRLPWRPPSVREA